MNILITRIKIEIYITIVKMTMLYVLIKLKIIHKNYVRNIKENLLNVVECTQGLECRYKNKIYYVSLKFLNFK